MQSVSHLCPQLCKLPFCADADRKQISLHRRAAVAAFRRVTGFLVRHYSCSVIRCCQRQDEVKGGSRREKRTHLHRDSHVQ